MSEETQTGSELSGGLGTSPNTSSMTVGAGFGTVTFNGLTQEQWAFARAVAALVTKDLGGSILAERERCARMVDHIMKEGGGTYGDLIRNA